jgi:hypothetical protein
LVKAQNEFVLIIDQFEEIFTYPEDQIISFKKELSTLLLTEIPSEYRKALEEKYYSGELDQLSEEDIENIHAPLNIKLLIVIRSDRMSLLNNLTDVLPNILKICYELKPLTLEQAEEAILNPAYIQDAGFSSKTFDYSDDCIEYMLQFLSQNNNTIESFQLQYLCQNVEDKVISEGISRVERKDLGEIDTIFEEYYEKQLAQISSDSNRLAAQVLIEETLVFEEEERRLSLYEGQIFKQHGFSPELLNELCDLHLLRSEPSLKGGYTYEIPHDTLIYPILRAKRKRLSTQREALALKRKEEEEKKLKELREKNKIANKRRRRATFLGVTSTIIALVAITLTFYVFSLERRAKAAEKLALIEKGKAQELSVSLKNRLTEYLQLSYEQSLSEATVFASTYDFQRAQEKLEFATSIDTFFLLDKGMEARQSLSLMKEKAANYLAYNEQMKAADENLNKGTERYALAMVNYRNALSLATDDNLELFVRNKIDALELKIDDEFGRNLERGKSYLQLNNNEEACRCFRLAKLLKPKNLQANDYFITYCEN